MFEEASQAIDALRPSLPFAYLVVFPVIVLLVSPVAVVDAAHEFSVYRMQQYELQGKSYGCKSSYTNMEARSVNSPSNSLMRKCLILRAQDLTYDRYREAIANSVGSILIFMPQNMSRTDRESFMEIEQDMLELQPNIPVYFTYDDGSLSEVYQQFESFATPDSSGSALEALVSSATSVGFQMVTKSSAKPTAQVNHEIINIEGMLAGAGIQDQLPTLAVVAHYDAFGVAPYLSQGANSDATGVVGLLEIARILNKFYENPRTQPKYNIVFLLSGGGKFNYQGTKKWIEDAQENPTSDVLSVVAGVDAVLCLDALSSATPSLKMHVSKPPSNKSAAYNIFEHVKKISPSYNVEVEMIHKKIRLSADLLAWEHERFSIRRLPAVTFSALESHEDPSRNSIMDTRETINTDAVVKNINIVADAVVQHIFNISLESDTPSPTFELIQKDVVSSWIDFLTQQSRPQQAMTLDHPVVKTLEKSLMHYASNVQVTSFKSDDSEQDFKFYDMLEVEMSASIVRSAVFDLYLSALIAAYVAIVYFITMNFESFRNMAGKMTTLQKVKIN